MVTILFNRHFPPYIAGEKADFDEEEAARICATKVKDPDGTLHQVARVVQRKPDGEFELVGAAKEAAEAKQPDKKGGK